MNHQTEKKRAGDSEGLEQEATLYPDFRSPATWSRWDAAGIGLQLLCEAPLRWLGYALGFNLLWFFSLPWLASSCGPVNPELFFVLGLPLALLIASECTREFHHALRHGRQDYRETPRASWLLDGARLTALVTTFAVLAAAGASLVHSAARPMGWDHAAWRWMELAALIPLLPAGIFAPQAVLIEGRGPFDALYRSWKLTSSASSVWMPLALAGVSYATTACGWLVLRAAGRGPWQPVLWFGVSMAIQLVAIWTAATWTAWFVAEAQRSPHGSAPRFDVAVLAAVVFLAPLMPLKACSYRRGDRQCFSTLKTLNGTVEMFNLDYNHAETEVSPEQIEEFVKLGYMQAKPNFEYHHKTDEFPYLSLRFPGQGLVVGCVEHGYYRPPEGVEIWQVREILRAGGVTRPEILLRAPERGNIGSIPRRVRLRSDGAYVAVLVGRALMLALVPFGTQPGLALYLTAHS